MSIETFYDLNELKLQEELWEYSVEIGKGFKENLKLFCIKSTLFI